VVDAAPDRPVPFVTNAGASPMNLTSRTAALSAVLALVSSSFAGIFPTDLVVFGDSLSDNGNLYDQTGFPPPPYFEGRFSNGPVWVEQAAPPLGLDPEAITDLAVGGSTTADVLADQVVPFVAAAGGDVDPAALYVIWAGSNDLLDLLEDPEGDVAETIGEGIGNLATAVTQLALSGADTLLVVNLPDFGLTPRAQSTQDPDVIGGATFVADLFNAALHDTLGQLAAGLDVEIIEIDAFELLQQIVANPGAYGLTNVSEPAMNEDGSVVENPDEYLFWDDIHPTTVGHGILSDLVVNVLGVVHLGDINADGNVDGHDLGILLAAWGGTDASADLDGSGTVDGIDLGLLLGAWTIDG
jgi:outer membrane lipase/esterase